MKQVIIPDRVQKEMLADFVIMGETRGLIGGYCEDEFPVYYANEEIFSREHNTTTGKVGGTGLGMLIVKKMVDLMGGSIEVESELGKGTIFTFTLMHKMADREYYNQKIETVEASDRGENLRGKHVLLAEDNDLNAEIAVTANAFAEDRKRAFDAGMNGHIAKPIDIEKLEAVILSVLNERELPLCSFTGNKNIEKISIKDVYEAERKIKHTGGEQLGKGNHKLEKNEKFTNYSLLYIRCRLYNTGSSAKEGQIRQ